MIILAIGVAITVVFLLMRDKSSSIGAICAKSVASFAFVTTAVCAIFESNGTNHIPKLLVVLGLVCGLIGDITLDMKIYLGARNLQSDSDAVTYFGMGCFAVGHILYITAVTIVTANVMALVYSAIIAAVLVVLTFVTTLGVLKMNFGKFLIPSIVYCFLLANFGSLTVWTLPCHNGQPQGIILLIGALMFLVSDLVLSYTYFANETQRQTKGMLNPESRFLISVNHGTYYVAQFSIALALLFI